jgi:hypothetical protein
MTVRGLLSVVADGEFLAAIFDDFSVILSTIQK